MLATLARDQAKSHGIRHIYLGNIRDRRGQSTYCPECGELVIERDGDSLGVYRLEGDRCRKCGSAVAGHFPAAGPEVWGPRRTRIAIT